VVHKEMDMGKKKTLGQGRKNGEIVGQGLYGGIWKEAKEGGNKGKHPNKPGLGPKLREFEGENLEIDDINSNKKGFSK